MKRNDILSGLALLASIVALIIVLTTHSKTSGEQHLQKVVDDKIENSAQAIRSELIEKLDSMLGRLGLTEPDLSADENALNKADLTYLVQQAKRDPALAQWLQACIESVIMKEMADQLASVDWLDTLSKENLQKLLTSAAKSSMSQGFNHFQTPVDVSDIEGVDGKIARILEEFDGVNSYSHNNALVKQMAEMGDEAIEPLLSRLGNSSMGANWAMRMAVTDALEKLLTENHEEIILAEFTKSGNLSKLIEKYHFPAAEEEVMNKITFPANGRVDQNVIDAALKINSARSIPLLIDYVSHGRGVSYAAGQLAAEGIDITEPLRMASSRAVNTWEKASLVELCLEREMPEGYDLAIEVLLSKEMHAEHSQEQVYQYIRKYTGINGSYDEVADWLKENRPN